MNAESFMRRAIELAKNGEGYVHPNPLVGAVIVKDGKIIGEGFHERFGGLHAERNALASLKETGESASGAEIYVTLEPCCHHGKTPPCTDAIIESGIKKVIIGSRDPNPKVAGKGVKILKDAGIEVTEDFLREECDELNPVFFKYITTGMPYVTLKYAMTLDGKIATKTGESKWISGEESREYVQFMRHANMGIMAGIGTVLMDDPMLNARIENGRDPVRIICDSQLNIPWDSKIVKSAKDQETIVACAYKSIDDVPDKKREALKKANVSILTVPGKDGKVDVCALLKELGKSGVDSVLLEGGGTLSESMISAGLVDEICVFLAPKIFGGVAKSPVEGTGVDYPEEASIFIQKEIMHFGDDLLIRYVKPLEETCLPA